MGEGKMTLDSTAIQIISNVIVLFGVIVAICTIIYNIRTAKKTQTANFYLKVARTKNTWNRYIFSDAFIVQENRFVLMSFPVKAG